MQCPVPVDNTISNEEREKSAWWKLRKWLLRIAYRVLERYGDPKIVRIETAREFAALFLQEFSVRFLKVCLCRFFHSTCTAQDWCAAMSMPTSAYFILVVALVPDM